MITRGEGQCRFQSASDLSGRAESGGKSMSRAEQSAQLLHRRHGATGHTPATGVSLCVCLSSGMA